MQKVRRRLVGGLVALALAAGGVAPAGATSLIRQSLDDLVARNRSVVVGQVLEAKSRWNEEGTFIVTDYRVQVDDVLKGGAKGREVTVTLLGGTVGDLTTLIIGGAELRPGRSYVLFLKDGVEGVEGVTLPDHSQGAFEDVKAKDGLRAVSQGLRHPLLPDVRGHVDVPGGAEGLPLTSLMKSVREIASRPVREEVQK